MAHEKGNRSIAGKAPVLAAEPPRLPTGELPSGKPQFVTIAGQSMVVMPEADYNVLIEAARDNIEDLADAAEAIEILKRIESGDEETFPAEIVHRITHSDESGESRIKLWREYRDMTQAQLGEAIGSNRLYISQLETGVRRGSIDTLQKIAAALRISIELVMPKAEYGFAVTKRRLDPGLVQGGGLRESAMRAFVSSSNRPRREGAKGKVGKPRNKK